MPKKICYAIDKQVLNVKAKIKMRRADGGVFTMVMGAAIGTLILISFYKIARHGLENWRDAFIELVKM